MMNETRKPREKVVLAGLLAGNMDPVLFAEDMSEMWQLCETAGAEVVAEVVQRRGRAVPGTFLGKGKLEAIRAVMEEHGAQTLIIDAQLSPGQIKSIESAVEGKVVDRGQLILDIFALHARTAEARIQVELAQMKMFYSRLAQASTHYSQQGGGIGTRGPGEKQLEVDRRLIQKKITELRKKLEKIERDRTTQRGKRESIFKAAVVGYTNVGKSTLLNTLSGSKVLTEDRLFATLDTAMRRVFIPGAGTIVVSDTVGLLRKLPHDLVASFRSTLREVREATLLLLVLDASSSWIDQQIETVNTVLADLAAESIPRIVILNKIDLVADPFTHKRLLNSYPDAVQVTARNKESLVELKERIAHAMAAFEQQKRKDREIAEASALTSPKYL